MLQAFFFSDIAGESRTIMAETQEEAQEIAAKLIEDIKSQKASQ